MILGPLGDSNLYIISIRFFEIIGFQPTKTIAERNKEIDVDDMDFSLFIYVIYNDDRHVSDVIGIDYDIRRLHQCIQRYLRAEEGKRHHDELLKQMGNRVCRTIHY